MSNNANPSVQSITSGNTSGGAHHHQSSQDGASATSSRITPAPTGFETFYVHERSEVNNLFQAFVLPLHWSLVRGGLRLRTNVIPPSSKAIPISDVSELLPSDWTSRISSKVEDGAEQPTNSLLLRYWDASDSSVHYEVKVIEILKDNVLAVMIFRVLSSYGPDGSLNAANTRDADSHSPRKNFAAINFTLPKYFTNHSYTVLSGKGGRIEENAWYELYKNLETFETVVWRELLEPAGVKLSGIIREAGPFFKGTSQNQEELHQSAQPLQHNFNIIVQQPASYPTGGVAGPLYVPPIIPTGDGGLGIGFPFDPMGEFEQGAAEGPMGFPQPGVGPSMGGPGGAYGLIPPTPEARFDLFVPPMQNPRPPTGELRFDPYVPPMQNPRPPTGELRFDPFVPPMQNPTPPSGERFDPYVSPRPSSRPPTRERFDPYVPPRPSSRPPTGERFNPSVPPMPYTRPPPRGGGNARGNNFGAQTPDGE